MKGWRTILVGAAMAAAPPLLSYLAGVDWTQYLPAYYAPIVSGLAMIGLRVLTTGAVASKD